MTKFKKLHTQNKTNQNLSNPIFFTHFNPKVLRIEPQKQNKKSFISIEAREKNLRNESKETEEVK